MKTLIVSLAALAAMTSVAVATDQPIDVTATVTAFCSIDGTTSGVVSPNKTIDLNAGGAITGGAVTATAVSVDVGTVVCNKNATAQLRSLNGGLFGPGPSGGMQNYINYNATTTLLQTQATVAATATSATPTNGTAQAQANAFNTANVNVTVTPVAASPLVAGSYADILTLRIEPVP